MSNGWTEERRIRQASMIKQWQPWQSSTGPHSPEGKKCSSRNARKPNSMREIRKAVSELQRVMNGQEEDIKKVLI